jgi:tetratricopeptide (TPR) repeat protein
MRAALMSERIDQLKKLLEAEGPDGRDVPFCLYGLAQEYAKAGDDVLAVEHYERALAADPSYCYAYFHQARSMERLGRLDDAKRRLEAGLAKARECGDAHAAAEIEDYLDSLA